MEEQTINSIIINWLLHNPIPSFICASIIIMVILAIIGFFQGKSISIWPPHIGGKPIPIQINGANSLESISVFDAIKIRKSVRIFENKPIENEKIVKLMSIARLAPSASNRQEWRFIIITDDHIKAKVANASCIGSFIKNLPVIIVACAETDSHIMQGGELSYPIDVAIALDHITLGAVTLGLGTCWIGMFDSDKIKKILSIPKQIKVVNLMVIGYPEDITPVEKTRLPLEKIVKYNSW